MTVLELTVMTWNLFHGRDAPPDPALRRSAWRLSGKPLDNGTYVGLNRSLRAELSAFVSSAPWSVCLLQETPPAWIDSLAAGSQAQAFCVPTSRNQFAPITRRIGKWRPDLIGSWEGGANVILVRAPWEMVQGERRSLLLSPWRERRFGERRRLAFARLRQAGAEVCVANIHAGRGSLLATEREVRRGAKAALEWSAGAPLVFGGDFNLRPARSGRFFDSIERDFSLRAATAHDAIDHLLVRGLAIVNPPTPWPDRRRDVEIPWGNATRLVRLSDHAPVEGTFRMLSTGMR